MKNKQDEIWGDFNGQMAAANAWEAYRTEHHLFPGDRQREGFLAGFEAGRKCKLRG